MRSLAVLPPEVVALYKQNLDAVAEAAHGAAMKQRFPCKAGCSWCCHRAAPVTEADVSVVRDAVKRLSPTQMADVHAGVQRWEAAAKAVPGWMDRYEIAREGVAKGIGPIGVIQVLAELPSMPCPFLTRDRVVRMGGLDAVGGEGVNEHTPAAFAGRGACMIYESRPLECRLHAAKDEQGRAHGCRSIAAGKPTRLATLDVRGPRGRFAESGAVTVGLLPFEMAETLRVTLG